MKQTIYYIKNIRNVYLIIGTLLFTSVISYAQEIDLSRARLVASTRIQSPVRETAIRTLQEEVTTRTGIKIPFDLKKKRYPLIILAIKGDDNINGFTVPKRSGKNLPENRAEGYRITLEQVNGQNILWLTGADDRGIIYAIGDFLRHARLSRNKILFSKKNEIATAPLYPLRGHQLGYRNTANSYDAWTVDQYEQYIRELALFGVNSIENTPLQDGGQSLVMKLPRREMNLKISKICNDYDLDYWIWVPVEVDLSDSAHFEEEVRKQTAFYKECPRLDGVFFPGGDPGNNDPKYVLPFLKTLAKALKKYHPDAGMWISLQGFSSRQVDYFFDYLDKYSPDWLTGVVYGPGSPNIAEERFRLSKKYKHRYYPDITHTVRCQYPVKNWDQAFALTEGREVSNPQPFYYAQIFHCYTPFTDGFISYSDGVHDDVNKIIWTQLAWNPEKDIHKILKEYTRFFFGADVAKSAAEGIIALERNWDGSIEQNGSIETTFLFWKNLEKQHPELKDNWRWQLLLLRNDYDTYTKRRKTYEQGLEKKADKILAKAPLLGPEKMMDSALHIVNEAETRPENQELRQNIVDLCAALYRSIGLQTSVKKYHAKNEERGAILDFLDYPLNNRWWLADQFKEIHKLKTREEKLKRLHIISTWDNPGPGSYYDDVSNISKEPHVKTSSYDATDIAWWNDGKSRERLSTQTFQNFPRLVYENLDPKGHYNIRISGEGDALLRINGIRVDPLVYNKKLGTFKVFPVASQSVRCGKITVTFDEPEESKLNWRNKSKICDIWLLKEPVDNP